MGIIEIAAEYLTVGQVIVDGPRRMTVAAIEPRSSDAAVYATTSDGVERSWDCDDTVIVEGVPVEPQTYEPGEAYRSNIACDEQIMSLATGQLRSCGNVFRIDGECIGHGSHAAVIGRRHAQDYITRAIRELESAEAAARGALDAVRASGHPDARAQARVDAIVETRSHLELLNP